MENYCTFVFNWMLSKQNLELDFMNEHKRHLRTVRQLPRLLRMKTITMPPSATCLENDLPECIEHLVWTSIKIYITNPHSEKILGHLWTIQPDGASSFVALSNKMFFNSKIAAEHPLYKHLHDLHLLNIFSGADEG
eukprot:3502405-Ditylum_brightwellii.AAC.1